MSVAIRQETKYSYFGLIGKRKRKLFFELQTQKPQKKFILDESKQIKQVENEVWGFGDSLGIWGLGILWEFGIL